MILLAHPSGNEFVRALLSTFDGAGVLAKFITTVGWSSSSPLLRSLPRKLRARMERRAYDVPHYKIKTHSPREIVRQPQFEGLLRFFSTDRDRFGKGLVEIIL